MGQRLNIEIEFHGESLANCYFHWSAYTTSAIALVKKIINAYQSKIKSADMPDTVKAIKCFESCEFPDFITGKITCAGLSKDSFALAKEKFKDFEFKESTSRDAGLVAIAENEMEDTRRFEEGRVEIDMTNEIVRFYVFWDDSIEGYITEIDMDEEPEKLDGIFNLPLYKKDTSNIRFDEFDDFAKFVENNYEFITIDSCGDSCITTRIE